MKNDNDCDHPNTMTIKQVLKEALTANLAFAGIKSIAVPFTQPIQVVMRDQQAALANKEDPKLKTAYQSSKSIAYQGKNFSLAPFFRGTGASITKEGTKNAFYKGSLFVGAPKFTEFLLTFSQADTFLLSPAQYHLVRASIAGIFAGSIDTIFGGTLESWATHKATSHGKHAKADFWGEVYSAGSPYQMLKRAYQGIGPTFIKGSFAFTTFFAASEPIQQKVCHYYGVHKVKDLTWDGKLLASVLVGGAVALTSSPFDIVKTQSQMPNPSKLSTWNAIKSNWKTYGIKGLTAGLPLKFSMIVIGWTINELVKQGLEENNRPDERTSQRRTLR